MGKNSEILREEVGENTEFSPKLSSKFDSKSV